MIDNKLSIIFIVDNKWHFYHMQIITFQTKSIFYHLINHSIYLVQISFFTKSYLRLFSICLSVSTTNKKIYVSFPLATTAQLGTNILFYFPVPRFCVSARGCRVRRCVGNFKTKQKFFCVFLTLKKFVSLSLDVTLSTFSISLAFWQEA